MRRNGWPVSLMQRLQEVMAKKVALLLINSFIYFIISDTLKSLTNK